MFNVCSTGGRGLANGLTARTEPIPSTANSRRVAENPNDVDLARVEIPDGDSFIRSANFRDGKSGRAAATGLLPDC